jgi:hypothetical protein
VTKRSMSVAAAVAALAVAAPAAQASPVSKVTVPGSRILATSQPVPLQMTLSWPLADLTPYTYQAYVWPSGNGPTLELVPLTQDPANPTHLSGTASATVQARWAARPGTYWIGVLATPKPGTTPRPCPPLPTPMPVTATASVAIACPLSTGAPTGSSLFEGIPHSKVTVAPPLTLMWARFVARQKAYKIGWHSTAPLTCTAPYVPSAYTCTFRWHTDYGVLVKRTVFVAQDTTTGRVTVTRAGA